MERDLEVSGVSGFPSLPIYLYGGGGLGSVLEDTPKADSGGGAMQLPESRRRSGARPSQVPAWTPPSHLRASVRTTLCFPGLEGQGLPKRFSLEKSWESCPFLCAPALRPSPAPTHTHTHTPRASSPGFPSGADYFMTGCDKW